ncbi:MAG: hypothetical protein WA897_03715 [Moheibacter sp.]
MKKLIFTAVLGLMIFAVSCSKEEKKRGLDYDQLKNELALNSDQSAKFDETAAKFKNMMEENKAANTTEGGKMNRTAFFAKMEEIYKLQSAEMSAFLDEGQQAKYNEFMDKNTRKRPRYNDELLAKIKTELSLDQEQSKVLEAANNAFEKEFQDAHDIYHGNEELAKEYREKFDKQRRTAIESVLSDEQVTKFRELVDEANQ